MKMTTDGKRTFKMAEVAWVATVAAAPLDEALAAMHAIYRKHMAKWGDGDRLTFAVTRGPAKVDGGSTYSVRLIDSMLPLVAEPGAATVRYTDEKGEAVLAERRAAELRAELAALDEDDEDDPMDLSDEACPGCGCMPGDGLTDGCDDEAGCGYYRAVWSDR